MRRSAAKKLIEIARTLAGLRDTQEDRDEIEGAAAAFGIKPEAPIRSPETEVYPENWPALELVSSLETQWRHSMAGRSGLIYAEAWAWMTEAGVIEREERMSLMRAVQVIERELLRIWRAQRENRAVT